MANNPNEGWRDGDIKKSVPPTQRVFLTPSEKPCIPVSTFWSHRYEQKPEPVVSHFQACSEGDVFVNQQKTEPEPLMGLASVFLLVQPDESKLKFVGWLLLAIGVSLIILYFSFRFGARKQRKKIAIKRSVEKQRIPPESLRHEDNLGVDGAAYQPLKPIKYK